VLKNSIMAPPGHILIDCDSSQIEARVLAWFAEQEDLVQMFANNDPVYEQMACDIYSVGLDGVEKTMRDVGKMSILGCGYGMGAARFQAQLAGIGIELSLDECRHIVDVYRSTKPQVKQLWNSGNRMLAAMIGGDTSFRFGREGVVTVEPSRQRIILPNSLPLSYHTLRYTDNQFEYKSRYGWNKIYGGKVVENVIQALARCIVAWQLVQIHKRYKAVITVHDSVVSCVRIEELDEAKQYIEQVMRTAPSWAEGVPLNCESGVGRIYGEC
ncbi:MAG TPA: DNA polymerase, partial [Candidatus Paceibacterota bacterium]|nr:DNA polymerase [Candidatus Paceibacterota bacterium]